jgi:hypothetical protein
MWVFFKIYRDKLCVFSANQEPLPMKLAPRLVDRVQWERFQQQQQLRIRVHALSATRVLIQIKPMQQFALLVAQEHIVLPRELPVQTTALIVRGERFQPQWGCDRPLARIADWERMGQHSEPLLLMNAWLAQWELTQLVWAYKTHPCVHNAALGNILQELE